MKAILAFLLLASSAFAQSAPAPTATAAAPVCGPENGSFDVKTDSDNHSVAQPQSGKAIVYFLQDDKEFGTRPRPTVKWGVDGAWVGATHANSYFYLFIGPGEHHLCATWQGAGLLSTQTAAAHFTAEAGQVYYFSARDSGSRDQTADVKLGPVDSDEALLLMSKFAFSTFTPKSAK